MGLLELIFKKKSILNWLNHRNLYLLGWATILCGLGWSNVLMSIGQFIIIGNWIIEFDFKRKLNELRQNKTIWVVLLLFLIHLIGLLWTSDFKYANRDITTKLPLLAFPIIVGTTKRLSFSEWKIILWAYALTLFSLSITSLGKYFGIWGEPVTDKRQLSIYISHIRYGLNFAFAVIIMAWYRPLPIGRWNFLFSIWFSICLVLFQLYTGLIILSIILLILFIFKGSYFIKSRTIRIAGYVFIIVALLTTAIGSQQVYSDFNKIIQLNYDQEDMSYSQKTINGERYSHEKRDNRKENGVYTRRFVARTEIQIEWNKRSELPFKNKQGIDNPIAQRLYRYLSSKGLKKDSLSLSTLTDTEIQAIENGVANYYYLTHNKLQNRLHKSLYEFREYQRTGNASGYSLAMRFEYWKTAGHIIGKNFWLGVGTGDIKQAFKDEYILQKTKLDETYQKRTHNQFLTFFTTFGLISLLIALFSIYYPIIQLSNNKLLGSVFIGIMSLSFITEDTLETQAGITLYAGFYCLIVFGLEKFQRNTSK